MKSKQNSKVKDSKKAEKELKTNQAAKEIELSSEEVKKMVGGQPCGRSH